MDEVKAITHNDERKLVCQLGLLQREETQGSLVIKLKELGNKVHQKNVAD